MLFWRGLLATIVATLISGVIGFIGGYLTNTIMGPDYPEWIPLLSMIPGFILGMMAQGITLYYTLRAKGFARVYNTIIE